MPEISNQNLKITKPESYLRRFLGSYQKAYPGLDVEYNWSKGLCLEKRISDKSLFFFLKYITEVDKDLLDDDYHWEMCKSWQDVKWCDNCKFFDIYEVRNLQSRYECKFHKCKTRPFSSCPDYYDDKGRHVGQTSISTMALHPRESLKTTNLVIGYTLWCWSKDLNLTFLHLTETDDLAVINLDEIKEQLNRSEKISSYYPWLHEAYIKAPTNTKNQLKLMRPGFRKRELSFYATGIGSSLQGGHYDAILYDDLVGLTNCRGAKADTVKSGYTGTLPLRVEGLPQQRYTATRWSHDDLTGDLIEDQNYSVVEVHELFYIKSKTGKLVFNDESYRQVTIEDCKRYLKAGVITDEIHIPYKLFKPDKILNKMREYRGKWFEFFCQYFNRPEGDPTRGFFRQWIKHMTEEQIANEYFGNVQKPNTKPYIPWELMNTYVCIDLATGSGGRNTADTAFIVWSIDCFGRYFLRNTWIGKESILDSLLRIFEYQDLYNPIVFTIERGTQWNNLKTLFDNELDKRKLEADLAKKEYSFPNIYDIPRGGQNEENKESRIISALQPLYELNVKPSEYLKIIHVGDKETHKKYESSILMVGEAINNKGLDGADAAADIQQVATMPNEILFRSKLEGMQDKDVELETMENRMREIVRRQMVDIERRRNMAAYGVEKYEMSDEFYYD